MVQLFNLNDARCHQLVDLGHDLGLLEVLLRAPRVLLRAPPPTHGASRRLKLAPSPLARRSCGWSSVPVPWRDEGWLTWKSRSTCCMMGSLRMDCTSGSAMLRAWRSLISSVLAWPLANLRRSRGRPCWV